MRNQVLPWLRSILFLSSLAAAAVGQGRQGYLNVESPQVSPLAIARIAGHDYLLVCNTPDNAIEIWDTDETIQPPSNRLLQRVAVGLEPVSVVWSSVRQCFYSADFLSDSVTSVFVTAPTGPASLQCMVDVVKNLGDEPVHLALTPDGSTLLVAFMGPDAMGAFDAATLAPIAPTAVFPAPTQLMDLVQGTSAINEPRRVVVSGGQVFVLGHKGGNQPTVYDFDLYSKHLTTGVVTSLGGLGSTNTGMGFGSNGDLFVVGGLARNDLIGGPAVTGAPTGFVVSQLHLVQNAGTASATVVVRDLNLESVGGVPTPVAPGMALALPTDVVVFEQAGLPTKVFIAAFGSDRIGVVEASAGVAPLLWPIRRMAVPPVAATGNTASGPRGLVLKPADAALRARLYVLNRLDNSVTVIDPAGETIRSSFALRDPTPLYIRQGRPFLYSAKLSASGFVSCASCHSDGRTDALGWDLGAPGGIGARFGRYFADGPVSITLAQIQAFVQSGFNTNKQLMVTQSLQGLLNYEVEPVAQDLVTNAPYHWRGDRADFTRFNEAFVNLFGLPDISTTPEQQGIPTADMDAFEAFVNSIHYPPNPEQAQTRVFAGSFGTANQNDGTGAQRGLKLFHTQALATTGGRSCVQCHGLPEGSNNRFTVNQGGGVPNAGNRQPIETGALRGLFQKEMRLERDAQTLGTTVTGISGLEHAGRTTSVNEFVTTFFQSLFTAAELLDLKHFVRELDWGVGPIVGQVEMATNVVTPATLQRIADFEAQVQLANTGLAVRAQLNNVLTVRGFRFDPIVGGYVEETPGGVLPALTRTQLLSLCTAVTDRMVFVCCPLGSDRRIAVPGGVPANLPPATPSNLQLLPMRPNTAYARVPELTKNWIPGSGPVATPMDFTWTFPNSLPTPLSLHSMRLMQYGLSQAGFGLTALRHDAPRRFRVAGIGIQSGARLLVDTPNDPGAPVPNPSGPLGQMVTKTISLPLFATGSTTAGGLPIWETAVEFDPATYYRMMLGGPFAPGVTAASTDFSATIAEPPPAGMFAPGTYNWHFVQVENPGAAPVGLGWQRLTIG